jgi:copper homeostasis protein
MTTSDNTTMIATGNRRVLLEVAVASADDVVAATEGGADRVELNAALMLGGLTPSLGSLLEARDRATIRIVAMVRPRSGGFAYTEREFATMRRDLDLLLAHGADGAAFGFLTPDGRIDESRTRQFAAPVGPSHELVFHRAFDVTPDPFEALETLIGLGVRRLMTSGQEDTAYNGAGRIAELIARAAGRIEVLPAGGINRFTIEDILARTGCDQVHASLKGAKLDGSTGGRPSIGFGGALRPAEDRYEATDPAAVTAVRARLERS